MYKYFQFLLLANGDCVLLRAKTKTTTVAIVFVIYSNCMDDNETTVCSSSGSQPRNGNGEERYHWMLTGCSSLLPLPIQFHATFHEKVSVHCNKLQLATEIEACVRMYCMQRVSSLSPQQLRNTLRALKTSVERDKKKTKKITIQITLSCGWRCFKSRVLPFFHSETAQLIDQFTSSRSYRKYNLYRIPSISQSIHSRCGCCCCCKQARANWLES